MIKKILLIVLSIITILVTKSIDPFINDINLKGPRLALFHIFLVILSPLLFFSIAGCGEGVRKLWSKKNERSVVDIIFSFFVGAAFLTVALSLAGLFGILNYAVSLSLFLAGIVAWSVFGCSLKGLFQDFYFDFKTASLITRLQLIAFGLVFINFYIVRLVWVIKDADVFTHYMPYYLKVVESGSLAPNNVWYHFFYSKGCALYFWAVSFSGSLSMAPLNGAFLLALILMIAHTLRKAIGLNFMLFGVTSVIMFFLSNIELVDPFKQHFILGVGIFSFIWFHNLRAEPGSFSRRKISTAMACVAFFLTLFYPTGSAILIGFLGIDFLVGLARGRPMNDVWQNVWVGVVTATTLAVSMLWNFLATGMYEINPFRLFWSLADQKRFSEFTSPYMVRLLEEGSAQDMGHFSSLTLGRIFNLRWYAYLLNLNILECLHITANIMLNVTLGFLIFITYKRLWSAYGKRTIGSILTLFLVLAVASLPTGKQEGGSLFRMFEFSSYCVLMVFFITLGITANSFLSKKYIPIFSLVLGFCFIFRFGYYINSLDYEHFIGSSSLAEYYETTGYFSKDVIEAKKQVGNTERIVVINWTNLRYAYVPGERLETEIDFSYKKWHRMVFASPEEAKAAFIEEGLNYFLIEFGHQFGSFYSMSPLFTNESIIKNFKIVSRQGNVYVLSWKENLRPGEKVSDEFLELWGKREIIDFFGPLYGRVKHYYDTQGERYPVIVDKSLDQLPGWQ